MSQGTPETTEATFDQRLALLLAMAMFVLVVDTSLMNVSISAVVHDLGTTVSGVQSAIALEALVSAAFILIGSKVGDLIGRKRAYVLGLLAYAVGRLGDDARPEPDRDHRLLGDHRRPRRLAPAAGDAVADPRQLRGSGAEEGLCPRRRLGRDRGRGRTAARRLHHHLPVVARRLPARGRDHRDRAARASAGSATCPTRAPVRSTRSARSSPSSGWAASSSASWCGRRVGRPSARSWRSARSPWDRSPTGSSAASATGKPTLIDPDLFRSKMFRFGITGQMLQQIALGGAMIALPIFLQMVLEYNALQTGLSLAPLSLTMFGVALLAGKRAGTRRPSAVDPRGLRAPGARDGAADRGRAPRRLGLVPLGPVGDRRSRARPAGVPAQQLHPLADRRRSGSARPRA